MRALLAKALPASRAEALALMVPFAAYLGSLLTSCSHPHTALGGFEGRVTLHTTEATGADSEFTVTARGDMLRIDVPPPSGVKPGDVTLGHVVYEHETNQARVFFDSTKEYRQMDLSSRIAADDGGPAAPALEKKGTHQTLAGVVCDDGSVPTPDGGHVDVCLAKGLAYLEIFRVHLGPHKTESSLAREYRAHSTFPLEMVEYDAEGKERARMRVTKVERASVDDGVFALPAGYTKVTTQSDQPPGPEGSAKAPR